ncbi:hypothetical protein ERJ75_000040200 [Trypanosoma vivax]|nr:hypothetical protein ERJ75_000040200 [Trypanosoma vivax]
MCTRFVALCEELSRLQVRLIRREGSPSALAMDAVRAIQANRDTLEPVTGNLQHVPAFLRCCATLLVRSTADSVHDALLSTSRLAEAYIDSNNGDVNESATVLRSLVLLSSRRSDNLEGQGSSTLSGSSALKALVYPCFHNTLHKWQQQRVRPHASTLLSLLRGTDAVCGEGFHFTPSCADISGLLPIKSKTQMEAKMQRCSHSRDILKALGEMQLSRLDAGICLSSQAEFGLYDGELCNVCCEVLFSTHALLTSQQLSQIVYNLGVLQHRHIHQKFFSSLVDFKQCNAEAVRQHVMGLAMLRQPPPSERRLMDGIFLHTLRPTDPLEFGSAPDAVLSPSWFVDIGHALACLGLTHFKYRLMMARTVRRDIVRLTTLQRCKMLYGLGGVSVDAVPHDLRASWVGKVMRTVDVLIDRLRDVVEPSDGPFVMHALLFAGVREHPMIPQPPSLVSGENPVDLLLSTWMSCPKERVLDLTERIRPRHLGSEPATTLSNVCTAIANNCTADFADSHRFGPLCEAIRFHGGAMNVDETLETVGAIQRIGIGPRYGDVLTTLLENLWTKRDQMTAEQQRRCCRLLEDLGHLSTAMELLEYMAAG